MCRGVTAGSGIRPKNRLLTDRFNGPGRATGLVCLVCLLKWSVRPRVGLSIILHVNSNECLAELYHVGVVSGHFGPETLRHCSDGSQLSGHFGTSTKVPKRHFGPKYRTVQHHGPNCPAIRTEMSHPMVRNVSPKFAVNLGPTSLFL